ncbi:hypothetical protein QAD02_008350 [Eretmocerus hayati]|uniref:Uncharacterized protein n=1 Tax=Eretmocerus hayati TaxID=131215 RepID=A0ACC2N6U0_9HYME|nr:hypothetical protein QAD02_008350 [Eretmocerus hayati]
MCKMVYEKSWGKLGKRQKSNRSDKWLDGITKKSRKEGSGGWVVDQLDETPEAAVKYRGQNSANLHSIVPMCDHITDSEAAIEEQAFRESNHGIHGPKKINDESVEDDAIPEDMSGECIRGIGILCEAEDNDLRESDDSAEDDDSVEVGESAEDDNFDWTSDEDDSENEGDIENFLNELDERMKFQKDLSEILDHTVPRHKAESLLKLLKSQGGKFESLPSRVSTLHKTSKIKVPIRKCFPGEYVHYGLRKCLEEEIVRHGLESGEELEMDLNIDGVNLKGNCPENLWPILGRLVIKGRKTKPFIIGVYHGRGKPKCVKTYLKDLVKELKHIEKNGLSYKGGHYTFKLRNIIADNPARSFIKCCRQHNHTYGCDKCCVKGIPIRHRMTFQNLNAKPRTNKNFRSRKHMGHHKSKKKTPFERFLVDMIKQFPLDPMHQIYLGVVKTILQIMEEMHNNPNIDFTIDYESFNAALEELSMWIPTEFAKRKVKSLNDVKKWKATHSRYFLLYVSVVLIPRFVPEPYAAHFLKLTCAIRILCDPLRHRTMNETAENLLRTFLDEFRDLYGIGRLVYNLHNLIHLASEVLTHGSADSFSAFPFENHMRVLKGFIKKHQQPLQQLYINLTNKAQFIKTETVSLYPKFEKCAKQSRFLPLDCRNRFGKLVYPNYVLTTELPNNVCVLTDSSIVKINYFGYKGKIPVLIGKKFQLKEDTLLYPIPSAKNFDICIVSKLSEDLQHWPISSISCKAVIMVHERVKYIVPFLHNHEEDSF